MVLSGSRRLSVVLVGSYLVLNVSQRLLFIIGSQCSHRFSVVLSVSRRFSVVLVGCRLFSMILSGSCWIS